MIFCASKTYHICHETSTYAMKLPFTLATALWSLRCISKPLHTHVFVRSGPRKKNLHFVSLRDTETNKGFPFDGRCRDCLAWALLVEWSAQTRSNKHLRLIKKNETNKHIYTYIYIYIERVRERERKRGRERGESRLSFFIV